MGFKDKLKQNAAQLRYQQERRRQWIAENGPCRQCGTWERLEVDHIDPSTKVDSHIWSWTKARRDVELAKCQVLCFECHKQKTFPTRGTHGRERMYRLGCRCEACTKAKTAARKRQPSYGKWRPKK